MRVHELQKTNARQVVLPEVQAPSLEGLLVPVRKPTAITDKHITAHLEVLLRAQATVTPLSPGDKSSGADEVCVNVLGYAQGRLVPKSPRFEVWVRADQPTNPPELAQAIELGVIGATLKIELVLPPDFEAPNLRGKPATYLVYLLAGQRVVVPRIDDPTFLSTLGVKKGVEVLARVSADLSTRRALDTQFGALQRALDVAGRLVEVPISEALLEQELWKAWREAEGKPLSDHGIVGQEQAWSFEAWSEDPAFVAEVRRRIRNGAVATAIMQAHPAEFTESRTEATRERWSSYLGLHADAWQRQKDLLTQLTVGELLLEKATLRWV